MDVISKGASVNRVKKLLRDFASLSKFKHKSFLEMDKKDVKLMVANIELSNYSEHTKYDLKCLIKRFFRFLGKEKLVDFINTSKRKVLIKQKKEVLTEEEIIKMIEVADNFRDKAIISLLYEAGLRPSELINLKIKDVILEEDKGWIIVHGKTGQRRILILSSVPLVRFWLESHPNPTPENYLFVNRDGSKLSIENLEKIVRKWAKVAGITKRVYPYLFRHSRATVLAKYLTEQQMKEFFGWSKDSIMPAVYVHLSGRDVDKALMELYGLSKGDKKKPLLFKAKKCPKCGFVNPPYARFCINCGERLF